MSSSDTVRFLPARDDDWEWIKEALALSALATLSPQRRSKTSMDKLRTMAEGDIERFHVNSKGPEMTLIAWSSERKRIAFVWVTMDIPFRTEGKSAWLLDIFVAGTHQRQGLAKRLMAEAEGWADDQGAAEMWLNVGVGNENALRLYQSRDYNIETMHLCKRL